MFEKIKMKFINKYETEYLDSSKYTHKILKTLSILKNLPGSELPLICEEVDDKN